MKLKLLKSFVVGFLVLCGLLVCGYVLRAPLLREAASAWVVNDPLTRADVIVVLGGGPATRPFAAARLFHLGLALKILLTNPRSTPAAPTGQSPTDADQARSILVQQAVPAADIYVTADRVSSTYEEALAVRNWAATNGVKRIIIPTDVFHTRRARWVFLKELGPAGIQVQMEAVPAREYALTNWWQHDQGITAFQSEILRYGYYRVKY